VRAAVPMGIVSWIALAIGVWLVYFVIEVSRQLHVWPF
jgi:hypothetical protein